MPYAICEVVMSQDNDVPMGSEFTIAGYMLQNVTVKGETALAFHSKYEVAFADELGNEWVRRLITEENKHDTENVPTANRRHCTICRPTRSC